MTGVPAALVFVFKRIFFRDVPVFVKINLGFFSITGSAAPGEAGTGARVRRLHFVPGFDGGESPEYSNAFA